MQAIGSFSYGYTPFWLSFQDMYAYSPVILENFFAASAN